MSDASGKLEGRSPAMSECTLTRIMTALDANLAGNIHGGVIMKFVDDAAGVVAARHSGGRVVTAAIDEMSFLHAVHIGDLVHAHARINWAGRTSMEVGVRIEAERWDNIGHEPQHTSTAYVVYVGLDDDEKPRSVPPVVPEDNTDRRRFREAEIRREARLARREAINKSRDG
ncbi:MAG: acyl-CoA thioesterase [Mycobacteriales bacterium]